MPIDASQHPAVILVFAMPTCHSCHRLLPMLVGAAERRFKNRKPVFYVYQPDDVVPPAGIPIIAYDISINEENVQALATQFNVTGTPVTIVLPRNGVGILRRDGAMTKEQIEKLLNYAESV